MKNLEELNLVDNRDYIVFDVEDGVDLISYPIQDEKSTIEALIAFGFYRPSNNRIGETKLTREIRKSFQPRRYKVYKLKYGDGITTAFVGRRTCDNELWLRIVCKRASLDGKSSSDWENALSSGSSINDYSFCEMHDAISKLNSIGFYFVVDEMFRKCIKFLASRYNSCFESGYLVFRNRSGLFALVGYSSLNNNDVYVKIVGRNEIMKAHKQRQTFSCQSSANGDGVFWQ